MFTLIGALIWAFVIASCTQILLRNTVNDDYHRNVDELNKLMRSSNTAHFSLPTSDYLHSLLTTYLPLTTHHSPLTSSYPLLTCGRPTALTTYY